MKRKGFLLMEDQNLGAIGPKKKGKRLGGSKLLIIVIGIAVVLIAAIAIALALLGSGGIDKENGQPYPPLDPSELAETKEEGFDIFEYDEYLECNRVIMLEDRNSGVSQSIDDKTHKSYGEGVALVYELLNAIMAGDADAYNSMVAPEVGHYESFTQQQLYDMVITRVSQDTVQGKNGAYHEYVFILEYKIRENNGSFKNNLPSDTARPFTVVVNNSSGKLLVVSVSEPIYVEN
jgi:hypothetical protein